MPVSKPAPNSVQSFLSRVREVDRRVYFALFWTVLAHALTRGSQVLRELSIASRFGISESADLVVLFLFVPTFVHQYLIANLPQAVVPIYMDEEQRHGKAGALGFHGELLKAYSLLLLGIAVVLWLTSFTDSISSLPAALSLRAFSEASPLFFVLMGGIFFFKGISSLLSIGLLAHRNFILPALVSCIAPLLLAGILFFVQRAFTVETVLAIVLVGHLFEALLIFVALLDQKIAPRIHSRISSAALKTAIRLHVPLIAGSVFMGLTSVVERWRVATLESGELAAYQYAGLIVTLPTVILSLPLSQICLTYFSKLANHHLRDRLLKAAVIFVGLSLLAGSLATLVLWSSAQFVTEHTYAAGVFKSSDHRMIAQLIPYYSLQIPFFLAGAVLAQAISACRANRFITIGSLLNLVLHFILSGTLIRRMGASGVALATSATYAFSAVLLLVFFLKAVRGALPPEQDA